MCSKWLNFRIGSKLITLINKSKLAFKKKKYILPLIINYLLLFVGPKT